MGLFASLRAPVRASSSLTPAPWADVWYTPEGFLSGSGRVSPEIALTLAPVWKGIRKISGGIASFQAKVHERLPRGNRPVPRHALSWTLGRQVNPSMTGFEFWETSMVHLVLRGRAFARKRIVPKPYPALEGLAGLELDPIHPDRVRVFKRPTRTIDYQVQNDRGSWDSFGQADILHLRGISADGIDGLVMTQYAGANLTGMLAAETYAQRFFKQGAMAAVAAIPERDIGPDGVMGLAKSVQAYLTSMENAHGVFVAPDKITLQTLGIDPEKAQLLLTRQLTSEQVEQWLDMPHGTLSGGKGDTYASAYQRAEDLVLQCFRPWVERLEAKIDADILQYADEDPLRYFLKFEMDSMLRGNAKERAEIHRIEIESGYGTRNEARLDEDREPIDGLDEPILALNMGRGARDEAPGRRGRAPTLDRAALITLQQATHLVRKEAAAATKAAERHTDGASWQTWLREFYGKHAAEVSERLRLPMPLAKEYAARQGLRLAERGVGIVADWEWTVSVELAELALSPDLHAAAARAATETAA